MAPKQSSPHAGVTANHEGCRALLRLFVRLAGEARP